MATETISETNTELAETNAKILALKPRVSGKKVLELALELNCSPRNIETYLAGKGKKLPFALELLKKLKVVAA